MRAARSVQKPMTHEADCPTSNHNVRAGCRARGRASRRAAGRSDSVSVQTTWPPLTVSAMSSGSFVGAKPGAATTFHSPKLTDPGVSAHVESMRSWANRAGTGSGEHEVLGDRLRTELTAERRRVGRAVLRQEQLECRGTGRETSRRPRADRGRCRRRARVRRRPGRPRTVSGPFWMLVARPEPRDGHAVVEVPLVEVLADRGRPEGRPRPRRGRRAAPPGRSRPASGRPASAVRVGRDLGERGRLGAAGVARADGDADRDIARRIIRDGDRERHLDRGPCLDHRRRIGQLHGPATMTRRRRRAWSSSGRWAAVRDPQAWPGPAGRRSGRQRPRPSRPSASSVASSAWGREAPGGANGSARTRLHLVAAGARPCTVAARLGSHPAGASASMTVGAPLVGAGDRRHARAGRRRLQADRAVCGRRRGHDHVVRPFERETIDVHLAGRREPARARPIHPQDGRVVDVVVGLVLCREVRRAERGERQGCSRRPRARSADGRPGRGRGPR